MESSQRLPHYEVVCKTPRWDRVGQDAGLYRAVTREKSVLPASKSGLACSTMSTVKEIEAAIRALPPKDREQLVDDLPSILPELNGDTEWERIIADPRPRPALTALGDQIEAQFKTNPERFPEIQDSDFDPRP